MDGCAMWIGAAALCAAASAFGQAPDISAEPIDEPASGMSCETSDADDPMRLSLVEQRDRGGSLLRSLPSKDVGSNHREVLALFDFAARTSSDPQVRAIAMLARTNQRGPLKLEDRLGH